MLTQLRRRLVRLVRVHRAGPGRGSLPPAPLSVEPARSEATANGWRRVSYVVSTYVRDGHGLSERELALRVLESAAALARGSTGVLTEIRGTQIEGSR